jgi:DNA-binding response OmpR family regulator
MVTTGALPVVLIAAGREYSLVSVLEGNRYAAVLQVHTGTLALKWARDLQPDTVIVEAELPDMSGIDMCRMLHDDVRVGHNVPVIILAPDRPTPEQRVDALRAGAWDVLQSPRDPEELSLKLQTYVQAKRNIDLALADGLVDPTTGLHSRPALVRRARELGALMSRQYGALACVVFSLEGDGAEPTAGSQLARTARLSDVVGVLGPTDFAVLAPTTDHAGAVRLAHRMAPALRGPMAGAGAPAAATGLRVGYDAVVNLKYSPIDPAELLARASAAVRAGIVEPGSPWVRRFDAARASRSTPPGLVLDKRSAPA